MSTMTAPTNGGVGAAIAGSTSTSPLTADRGRAAAPATPAAVTSAVATQYWAELLPIPAAAPRLWLFADSAWRVLNGATALQFEIVQEAFLSTGSTVTVWYDGTTVSGLVVSGS